MTPEGRIENALVRRCQAMGWMIRKVSWIGRVGAPDRVVLMPGGRTVWIELKKPGGKLSWPQRCEIKRMRALGHDVRVIDSLEVVERFA